MAKQKGVFLSKKKTKEILEIENPTIAADYQRRIEKLELPGKILLLAGGRVLDYLEYEQRGILWDAEADFEVHLTKLEKIGRQDGPIHMLKGHLHFGEDFLLHKDSLIQPLASFLEIPIGNLDFSLSSLELLRKVSLERDVQTELFHQFFAAYAAYLGEVMRLESKGSWVQEFNTEFEVWEPFIKTPKGLLNPWKDLWIEFDHNPEAFNLRIVVEAELYKFNLLHLMDKD